MSNNKQSSIDKFIEAIMKHDKSFKEFYGAEIEQAKAMHKEEMIQAWSNGYDEDDRATSSPLKYYNETFGSK